MGSVPAYKGRWRGRVLDSQHSQTKHSWARCLTADCSFQAPDRKGAHRSQVSLPEIWVPATSAFPWTNREPNATVLPATVVSLMGWNPLKLHDWWKMLMAPRAQHSPLMEIKLLDGFTNCVPHSTFQLFLIAIMFTAKTISWSSFAPEQSLSHSPFLLTLSDLL